MRLLIPLLVLAAGVWLANFSLEAQAVRETSYTHKQVKAMRALVARVAVPETNEEKLRYLYDE